MKAGVRMYCDYHVHSDYSDDSTYEMREVVKDAIRLELDEICFTDHFDLPIEGDDVVEMEYVNVDFPRYFRDLEILKKDFKDKITIKKGLEFGIQYETIPEYQKIAQTYPFDFILLSVHEIDNKGYWNRMFQKGKTQSEYYHAYYEAMYKIIQNFDDYSVLAHMDLIRRYDEHNGYEVMNDKEMITTILKHIIANGKGLEVNMSCVRYGIGDLTPSVEILKLYKELGGTILTIGSDSHQRDQLGSYIQAAKKQLKDIGFTTFCTFEHMMPTFHKL